MPKGIHDDRYRKLIERLIAARKAAELSQATLATKLGKPQQFVSRYELGERRLDIVEFIDVAGAIGIEPLQEIAEIHPLRK
ncbi:helix-turn-helix transcriptional regulator [Sphingobium sp. TB-6]|uniref:helix-turn-helix domain-containing protein n=1 Tax=Sphingobium sp. TB-6 TaxID=2728850 RepID=UPI00146ECDFE|nr:helix-turn-helix transcriptional regulator [Sphingobium sp. TB-6]NML92020.1 helix-turn-helix transcriptional regulator [Sphingobium sp. TB-6]